MRSTLIPLALGALLAVGCSCGSGENPDGSTDPEAGPVPDAGPGGGMDAGPEAGTGMDAGPDAVDAGLAGEGGVVGGPIPCQGHIYLCGDSIDNDMDGLVDDEDPDCLGPCDNNEGGFDLEIPGGSPPNCSRDCYFDQDDGAGNDDCAWDFRCDPLSPGIDRCSFVTPTPMGADCPATQSTMCADVCAPLVPNGCDCFGCCNLPAGGDRYVYIGTTNAAGEGTCSLDVATDDTLCHPCTPVDACLNTCGTCELCLGRTELPPECFPPVDVDAGPEPDGGWDGGAPPPPPPPTCDDGRQACGVDGLDPCPADYFCITGCCTFFG